MSGLRARGGPDGTPGRRLIALLAVMVLALVAIVARLSVLQVKDASALQRMAVDQRIRSITLPAPRGTIYDRDGRELAMSLPARTIYADPQLVKDPAGEARTIAAVAGLNERSVQRTLQTKTSGGRAIHFVYVQRGITPEQAAALERRHLSGIGFLGDTRRYYPNGALAPQVIGFVGVDGTGLTGLEKEYQSELAGRPGREVVQVDQNGTFIPQAGGTVIPPVPGDDLVTTIDREIQFRAQQALAQAVRRNGAKSGIVLVMDPRDGDILAMADYPWFNPNDFQQANPATFTNRAVTDVYEPGSVNKVVTAAAALQDGVLTPTTRFTIPDRILVDGTWFHDAEFHPTEQMTLADILAYSSNVGAIQVAALLGKQKFASYLYRFGFGRPTGIDFPGESPGLLPPPSTWSGTSMATIPFGQGIAVTPLQMATVYATIANGGVWVQPHLLRGMIGPTGRFQPAAAPRTHRVVSEATARTIARMLGYAVDVGTGTNAQIPGFWVAGKTGTANIPRPDGGGYTKKYMASFIGFTPAGDPSIVVAAILDQPTTVYGGIAAAPLFQQVARFALGRLHVPPAPRLPVPPHAIPPPATATVR